MADYRDTIAKSSGGYSSLSSTSEEDLMTTDGEDTSDSDEEDGNEEGSSWLTLHSNNIIDTFAKGAIAASGALMVRGFVTYDGE